VENREEVRISEGDRGTEQKEEEKELSWKQNTKKKLKP
jgi:hypothetical protein